MIVKIQLEGRTLCGKTRSPQESPFVRRQLPSHGRLLLLDIKWTSAYDADVRRPSASIVRAASAPSAFRAEPVGRALT